VSRYWGNTRHSLLRSGGHLQPHRSRFW